VTLLCLSFAAYAPAKAQAALLLQISPGPAANQTTWTFSGDTATGFGNFRQSGSFNESEPFGAWGDFPNFTVIDGVVLTKLSGSADITWTTPTATTVRPIGNAWVDDGSDGHTVSWSGSLVMDGAGISAFSAGGVPYTANSTRFYNEPNTIPLTLSIVVPEPGACLLSLAALAMVALRRSRS
jgi:hypothetical protein